MATKKCVEDCPEKTWQKAKERLFAFATSGNEIYFRGQPDEKWGLKSSFGRLVEELVKQCHWPASDRMANENRIEKGLWEKFRKAHFRIPEAVTLPDNEDDEFIAYAQHYGLPTPLLDWSTSPYIAAFFAFEGDKTSVFPPDREVAIWVIDWTMYEWFLYCKHDQITPEDIFPNEPANFKAKLKIICDDNRSRIERVRIKGNRNRRMIYQEGLFTRAVKVEDDIASYLRSENEFVPGTVLTKIIIPGSEQAKALKDLSLMAITPVTLMNDPNGAAATAFNDVVRFNYTT